MSDVTIPSEYIPRWIKVTALSWPIAVALGAMVLSSGRSDAKAEIVADRVTVLEKSGSPAVRERLARIEQNQINQDKTLERMEKKLDIAIDAN